MDLAALTHEITPEQKRTFETDGLLIVENALPAFMVDRLTTAVDRIWEEELCAGRVEPHQALFYPNFLGHDEAFVELLDWPTTFPLVYGLLGWNIYLYHTHLGVTPPLGPDADHSPKQLGWHQDSGRVNQEMETHPRPRLSLKIGYFLSDVSVPGRGNFHVVPGSHLTDTLDRPSDGVTDPAGATPVCVKPGTAVFFDRRLWHSASPNHSDVTRKVLFYGYGYRWLRTKDDMTVGHILATCTDPIRRQLLGVTTNANGLFSPVDADVPLKVWLEEHR
ncbi:MAG: phytanoyl-CoA dioxygenase family protein [candidate division Zixibacteria bacterium]|nr:phytanoyl-CoA dioxygenase family protein [candidate division Zixibacteria bacterium]